MKEPTPPSFGHPVQYRRVPRLDTRRRVVILRRILSCFGSAPLVNRHSRGHGERTRDRWMNLRAASSQWSPVGLRPDFPSRGEEGLSHAVWWECPPRDQQTHHGVRAARQAGQSWWAWALDVQYALALPHQPPSEACTLDSEAATGRHSSSTRTVRRRLPHRQPTTVADGRHPRGCVWHGPAAEQAPACQPSLPPPSHPSLMYYWSQTLCPRLLTLPKETLSTPPPPPPMRLPIFDVPVARRALSSRGGPSAAKTPTIRSGRRRPSNATRGRPPPVAATTAARYCPPSC